MSSGINWQPNANVRKASLFEIIRTVPLVLTTIPIALGWVCVRRLFTRGNKIPLKEDLFLSTLRFLNPLVPLSLRRQFFSTAKPNLVLTSNRYSHAKDQLLNPVAGPDFAGVWICKGPAPVACTSNSSASPPPSTPSDCDAVIFWLYGGAYCLGSPIANAVQLLRIVELAQSSKISLAVFALDYSVAPETRFPAQTDQAFAAYKYLVNDQDIDAAKIVVGGVSAGGHLALALLHRIAQQKQQDEKIESPGGALLVCPWVDLTNSFPSMTRNARIDMLTKTGLDQATRHLLGGSPSTVAMKSALEGNDISQIINFAAPPPPPSSSSSSYIPLSTMLPPTTRITVGSHDLFIDSITSFVSLAESQGAKNIDFEVKPGKYHAWEFAQDVADQPQFLAQEPGGGHEVSGDLLKGSRYLAEGVIGIVGMMRKLAE